MQKIENITGRLGNQMFQFAFLYAYSLEHGVDKYFQDPKWFEGYEEEVKAELRAGMYTVPADMVAIHVRRGDYVGHSFYVDLMETGYYDKAMALFPNEQFVVFSDDIEWCKKQEIFEDCEFFHGSEIEDMNTMMSCTGHIIANSSFSWWAAYLAPFTKKVVAPSVKNWYTDGKERTVCPKEWLRI